MESPVNDENPFLCLAAPTLAPGIEYIHAARRGDVCDVGNGKGNVLVIANVSKFRLSDVEVILGGMPEELRAVRQRYEDGLHPLGCVVIARDVPPPIAEGVRQGISREKLSIACAEWRAAQELQAAEHTAKAIADLMEAAPSHPGGGSYFPTTGGAPASGAMGMRA